MSDKVTLRLKVEHDNKKDLQKIARLVEMTAEAAGIKDVYWYLTVEVEP